MGAAYRCRVGDYDASTAKEKLGHLIASAASSGFSTHFHKQTAAWEAELKILSSLSAYLSKEVAGSPDWFFLFEYEIPRRERRPDVVLLAGDLIFVLEFKIGAETFAKSDEWQAYSYALDLRDFHSQSAGRTIVPVLIATSAVARAEYQSTPLLPGGVPPRGCVMQTLRANAPELGLLIAGIYSSIAHDATAHIDPDAWEHGAYRPTPTIIEAAEQLFGGHGVSNISHNFATNLVATTNEIVKAVQTSQAENRRTICFVTGTPGAGKTLAGLNAVHDPALRKDGRPSAVFLSGNGPLVKIVREALIRDQQRILPRDEAKRVVSTFIANVHQFLVQYGIKEVTTAPHEHAIVFDEAQRAWDAKEVKKKHDIDQSEASLVLQIMERAEGWCTVVALVGGGQEINRGEAGLEEWGRALRGRTTRWRVMASPELLKGGESVAGHRLFESEPPPTVDVVESSDLHLTVSVRSPRAKLLSQWVDGLLRSNPTDAVIPGTSSDFPIVLTRDLNVARRWLKTRSDPKQRAGLLASSGALRLRPYGLEISSSFRQGYPYTDWFLSGLHDTRSSMWLEVAATEFECQGLELDWTCVCWGEDFVIDPGTGSWMCRKFRGTKWQQVGRAELKQFIVNKYRVLLTRARSGMVIWIPNGDQSDSTRDPKLLDATAKFLIDAGVSIF
ncbi:MAG: DUF2075 domain-containing protein [Planctomycetota bacterium]|nr:DUF2075 domain-containing protein [Planctomycetota bacterium]